MDVASGVVVHKVDVGTRVQVEGGGEGGGSGSSARHEVERSVRKGEDDFVVGDNSNFAGFSGGEASECASKGRRDGGGGVGVGQNDDGGVGPVVGVCGGVLGGGQGGICDCGGGRREGAVLDCECVSVVERVESKSVWWW